mmetsp:Transcript_46566/g.97839  ORF Transcript_46566/g.97839 Transcript_46566/m.97839 type:complete len:231 (-) Transcript_46566:204-896(-)
MHVRLLQACVAGGEHRPRAGEGGGFGTAQRRAGGRAGAESRAEQPVVGGDPPVGHETAGREGSQLHAPGVRRRPGRGAGARQRPRARAVQRPAEVRRGLPAGEPDVRRDRRALLRDPAGTGPPDPRRDAAPRSAEMGHPGHPTRGPGAGGAARGAVGAAGRDAVGGRRSDDAGFGADAPIGNDDAGGLCGEPGRVRSRRVGLENRAKGLQLGSLQNSKSTAISKGRVVND